MRSSGLVLYFWMFLRLSDKCDALPGVTWCHHPSVQRTGCVFEGSLFFPSPSFSLVLALTGFDR